MTVIGILKALASSISEAAIAVFPAAAFGVIAYFLTEYGGAAPAIAFISAVSYWRTEK